MSLSVSYIKTLEKFLDFCTEKNTVISKNIANASTVNYKREDISFNECLQQDLADVQQKNSKHIPIISQQVSSFSSFLDPNQEKLSGLNNVDIEKEMSELAANSMSFKLGARKLGDYYKSLQYVIKGDKA